MKGHPLTQGEATMKRKKQKAQFVLEKERVAEYFNYQSTIEYSIRTTLEYLAQRDMLSWEIMEEIQDGQPMPAILKEVKDSVEEEVCGETEQMLMKGHGAGSKALWNQARLLRTVVNEAKTKDPKEA